MENNQTLQRDVLDALKWEPLLKDTQIGVTAEDGIVTLTGTVDSYAKKVEAEDAAKNVIGVKAVVEKIEIKFYSPLATRNDHEIASEVINAFERNKQIPADRVKVRVENAWVTLEGELPWNFQKEAVQKAVKVLFGIKGITDTITIKAETQDAVQEEELQNAFRRNASLDARKIAVDVSGTRITLSGTVTSGYQKSEAGRLAWNSPGVSHVQNDLVVEYGHAFVD
ncbi:BON domain-containing protein [Flavisolibacter ginsenosidimutans]|uniref:BON domain-containing protein n=1 Tax=Flavisolibacter ginsenosidimutans TaxID=661481 RepID=A0A5B8UP31_9BACT|nr:BON domain-containing protein [Flavisolibacter ginsenosidimutans]QEC57989.1 BON domain-containing protein [Flavisolibacter ginsenosidimutans]